ncbi:MAG: Maf family protein [Bacteroidia bacterium]|nr:Maf family protein [Bacteroidia bacterium]
MKQLPAPVILGSQSPRRQELLAALNIPFEIIVRPTDEHIPEGASPEEAVAYIARQKAAVFTDLKDSHLIITADTIVVLGEEIIGKPADEAEGIQILRKLSGQEHIVMTGVCILYQDKKIEFVEKTSVFFRELPDTEIIHYLRTYKPYDKAGAYGVQEWIGMTAITRMEGDFYNVMGLPVSRLYLTLNENF